MSIAKSLEAFACEVAKIGLGDPQLDKDLVKAFRCYGGKPLEGVECTTCPSNLALLKILQKSKFKNAPFNSEQPHSLLLEYARVPDNVLNANSMYENVTKHFQALRGQDYERWVTKRERVEVIDSDENKTKYTASWNQDYQRVKFHFEWRLT